MCCVTCMPSDQSSLVLLRLQQGLSLFVHRKQSGKMSSGVTVNDEAVDAFNAFKLHRAPHDNRYFVYKIENDAEIVIDTFGDKSKTYDDFCACLPANECRYGVFDLDFTTQDGRQGNKLVFISWSPDTAKIKNKMVYAASKEAIKSALMGVGIHLQATDQGELELDHIKAQVQKI